MKENEEEKKIPDHDWYELVKAGEDAGWKLVWERVVEPESKSMRSAEMMDRFSLSAGDLMGMLYEDMIARRKIDLYRDDGGSFEGWLKRYVRGYILNADPNPHGEISIEGAHSDSEDGQEELILPDKDNNVERSEAWNLTHLCFRDLWNEDPERAYIHLLKTRFMLSSDEIRDFLEISSAANVDKIFSRSIQFMRHAWDDHDRNGILTIKG
ncbi:MAG: hypothetical protein IJQ34_07075 [Kiritimatiellae bacterium]|nr:hypothetical protein [Kiritimatiellia bacterium]